jgi:Tol biopolymer transport system component
MQLSHCGVIKAAGWMSMILTGVVFAFVTASGIGRADSSTILVNASVGTNGELANGSSSTPSLSHDGRYLAFDSAASNLVPNDVNGKSDVFVRDLMTGTTELISRNNEGVQGDDSSTSPSISGDGRLVAFASRASNLGGRQHDDIYVYDRHARTLELITLNTHGQPANSGSDWPAISGDGRFVAFTSFASDLVPGDTEASKDLFVRDRQFGLTERLNVTPGGSQSEPIGDIYAPSVNSDGQFVAFDSTASDLVDSDTNQQRDTFLRDRQTHTTTLLSGGTGSGATGSAKISSDGTTVTFSKMGATYIYDRETQNVSKFVKDR